MYTLVTLLLTSPLPCFLPASLNFWFGPWTLEFTLLIFLSLTNEPVNYSIFSLLLLSFHAFMSSSTFSVSLSQEHRVLEEDKGMKKYEALVFKVFYFLLSTTILAMLGVLSLVSSTIPLPRNHAAKSTRMLVFILFHVLVAMISCGSSSEPGFDTEFVATPKVDDLGKKEEVEACAYGDKDGYEGDDEYDEEEEEEEEEERHGDLRERIEEFIGSVPRTWKEELLKERKLLCLVEDTESLYMLVPCEKWCS